VEIVVTTDPGCPPPSFRFSPPWARSELVLTGAVGEGGDEWKPLAAALKEDALRKPQVEAEKPNPKGKKAPPAAKKGAPDTAPADARGPATLSWRKSWPLADVDENWALQFADEPELVLWATESSGDGRRLYSHWFPLDTSALLAPSSASRLARRGEGVNHGATSFLSSSVRGPTGRSTFRFNRSLDASNSSDSSDSDDEARCIAPRAATEWTSDRERRYCLEQRALRSKSKPFVGLHIGPELPVPEAPPEAVSKVLDELKSGTDAPAESSAERDAALSRVELLSRQAPPTLSPPPALPRGIVALQVRITASHRLLSRELEDSLNPFVIELGSVRDLPGCTVVGADAGIADWTARDPHGPLAQECRPVHLVCKLFGRGASTLADGADADVRGTTSPERGRGGLERMIQTIGLPHARDLTWNHRATVLLGAVSPEIAKARFQSGGCSVQLLDRVAGDSLITAGVLGRAKMPTGSKSSEGDSDSPAVEEAAPTAIADQLPRANAPAGTGLIERRTWAARFQGWEDRARSMARIPDGDELVSGVDLEGLRAADRSAWIEYSQSLLSASLLHPHGEATMRLEAVMDRSGEQLRALRRFERRRNRAIEASKRREQQQEEALRRERLHRRLKAQGKEVPTAPEPTEEAEEEHPASGSDSEESGGDSSWIPKSIATPFRCAVEARSRRLLPPGGEPQALLDPVQKLVRRPGAYADSNCRLVGRMCLRHPVALAGYAVTTATTTSTSVQNAAELAGQLSAHGNPWAKDPPSKFSRLVLCCRYTDDGLFRTMLQACEAAAWEALPSVESLLSHRLSDEEMRLANAGELDILTGFQVVDANWRVMVVEGLVERPDGRDGALIRLRDSMGEFPQPTSTLRVLFDPDVRSPTRLYGALGVIPRSIKLRALLADTVKAAGFYSTAKAPRGAAGALRCVWELRRCPSLRDAGLLSVFPSAEAVLAIEMHYGTSVSLSDLQGNGWEENAEPAVVLAVKAADLKEPATEGGLVALTTEITKKTGGAGWAGASGKLNTLAETALAEAGLADASKRKAEAEARARVEAARAYEASAAARYAASRRKAPTDDKNPRYERERVARSKRREASDALHEHVQSVAIASAELTAAKEVAGESLVQRNRLPPEIAAATGLETIDQLREHREALPGGVAYPYSGQKRGTLDWHRELQRERLVADKKGLFTHSLEYGQATVSMVNGASLEEAEKKEEVAKRVIPRGFVYPAPKKPVEYIRHPRAPTQSRVEDLKQAYEDPTERVALEASQARQDMRARGKAPFQVSSQLGQDFGYVDPETGEHKDAEFLRSVHTAGSGRAKELLEDKLREKEEFERRVVVADTKFRPHFTKNHATQVDRAEGILRGKPQKLAVKMVRKATLPSGKVIRDSLVAPSRGIMTQEKFQETSAHPPPLRGPEFPTTRDPPLRSGSGAGGGRGMLQTAGKRALASTREKMKEAASFGATLCSTTEPLPPAAEAEPERKGFRTFVGNGKRKVLTYGLHGRAMHPSEKTGPVWTRETATNR
jgi:hypothetical protein